ncbi:MAG TPA: PBP1A family penicillin-binding protein [Alphaproteobacteria bacterium]
MAKQRKSESRRDGDGPPRQAGRRNGVWRWVLKWILVLGIWAVVVVAIMIAWFAYDLPDVSGINNFNRRPSLTFVSADGQPIATYGDIYAGAVGLNQMSPWLPKAVLATEDRRFYGHFGVDLVGLARASFVNLRARRIVQGGSTISQQLAKNVFLSPERSFRRKVQEVLLALWLEHKFSKDQILTIYLNRVYLGAGTYGVEAAAQRYFGKPASQLTAHEAAVIAGLLKAPSRFSPAADPDRARARAHDVLNNLVEAGYMQPQDAAAAERQPLRVAVATHGRFARYFTDWLADTVPGFAGFVDRDLTIITTLDSRLQRVAEDNVARHLSKDGPRLHASQGAFVALSTDGAVRAMVGGRDYADSQFNRATDGHRQPGSAFKPFVFLAAVEGGMQPDDRFSDGPVTIGDWSPHNFDSVQHGMITAREALARSVNTATVRVAQQTGIDRVVAVASRLGIGSPLRRDLATALGASEVTLLELTAAFAPFSNGGNGVLPYAITEIRDAQGNIVYRREGSGPGRVILRQPLVAMTNMLQAVVQEGTGRAAMLDRPTAGKTGTSQDFRDAWFVGFTADYVAGVWLGNDNGEPMLRVTGGNLPARIWHDVMMEAERGQPSKALPGAPGFMDFLPSFLTGRSSSAPTAASSSPGAATYKPLLNLDPYNRPGAAPPP